MPLRAAPVTPVPDRAARRAVSLVFATNGLMLATWFVRIPLIQSSLGVSDGILGLVFAVGSAAMLLALPVTGGAVGRFGSRRVIAVSLFAVVAAAAALPHATGPVMLAAFLVVLTTTGTGIDIGANAQGLGVEGTYGRSLMVGFHAWWSIGSMVGAGLGSLTLRYGVSSELHFAAAAVVVLVVTLAVMPWLRLGDRPDRKAPAAPRRAFAIPRGALVPIAVIGFGGALGESLGNDWSGVFMRDAVNADEAQLGYGFVALTLAMTLSRLVGDRVTDRLGSSRAITLGAWAASAGLLLVAAVPTVPAALAGFFLVGIGVGAIIPLCMAAGGKHAASPAEGLAAVATVTYAAFLVGPPVVGWLNDTAGIRWSMALGALVVLLAAGRRRAV